MKINVLGSSSSGNCYVVESIYGKLILDAGVKLSTIMRAIDWDVESAACLITHMHSDHCQSAEDLARRNVDVVAGLDVARQIKGAYELEPMRMDRVGWFNVVPFDVPHGGTDCYGYYIGDLDGNRLLYATDYEYIPYNFKARRLTHMIIECNYTDREALKQQEKYEHVARGHAALETARGVVEANMTDALRFVLLCHVSATEDAEAMRAQIQALVGEDVTVAVARRGDCYEV